MSADRNRIRIMEGWDEAGREGESLGEAVRVYGIYWTPVIWDDEEDPEFFKTAALEIIPNPNPRHLGPWAKRVFHA